MFRINRTGVIASFLLILSASISLPAAAQTAAPPQDAGPLTQLANDPAYSFSAIERLVASSEQATLNTINTLCDGECQAGSSQEALLNKLNAMSGAASLILQTGSSSANAQLAAKQLGIALRAAAPEEYSSQRAASSEFANNQLSSLAHRLTALRSGAHGFTASGLNSNPSSGQSPDRMADETVPLGGAAGADTEIVASRWGGFLDGSYGWGKRTASSLEDAFKYDGSNITAGIDYRVSNRFVFGGMVGYIDQKVDFDPAASQTSGNIKAKGYSLNIYALLEWDGPYLSGAVGRQKLTHDSLRHVQYQLYDSTDTPIPGSQVDETETGSTHSGMWTSTMSLGWSLHDNAFGYEPYMRFEYRDMKIDGFTENSFDNLTQTVGGYGVTVATRSVTSLTGIAGFKAQYTCTPSFGVVVPYLKAEFNHEFRKDPLQTEAAYNALDGTGAGSTSFDLPSDHPDQSYYSVGAGATMVLKGGFQAFLQYQKILGLEHVANQSAALGIRTEF